MDDGGAAVIDVGRFSAYELVVLYALVLRPQGAAPLDVWREIVSVQRTQSPGEDSLLVISRALEHLVECGLAQPSKGVRRFVIGRQLVIMPQSRYVATVDGAVVCSGLTSRVRRSAV